MLGAKRQIALERLLETRRFFGGWEKIMPISADIGPAQGGWRNDHTFSSGASVYGFDQFIVPEVQAQHPDWSVDQIQQESRVRFMMRYVENLRFARNEQKGEDTLKTWREEEHNGERVLVVHGGAYDGWTLERLWDQTNEYAKSEGNSVLVDNDEYRAQKEFHRQMISEESTSTASVIGHPDSVKIFQSFSRSSDGLFYAHQIDLEKATGRTLTLAEGKILMAKLYEKYEKQAVIAQVRHDNFMLTSGTVALADVQMVARAIVLTSGRVHQDRHKPTRQHDDTSAMAVQNSKYVDRQIALVDIPKGTFDLLPSTRDAIVTPLIEVSHHVINRVDKEIKTTARSIYTFIEAKREIGKEKKDDKATNEYSSRENRITLANIRANPKKVGEAIAKRNGEMRKSAFSLAVIAKTRVAIGAVPWLLASLARELPKPIQAVEKSIGRHHKKARRDSFMVSRGERKMRKGVLAKSFEFTVHSLEKKRSKRLVKIEKREAFVVDRKERKRRKRALVNSERLTVYRKEKKREANGRVRKDTIFRTYNDIQKNVLERQTRKKEYKRVKTQLVGMLVRIGRELGFSEKKHRNKNGIKNRSNNGSVDIIHIESQRNERKLQRKEFKRKQKEIALKFSLAVILWLLVARKEELGDMRREQTEVFVTQRLTQWVLLSIIWHLAMIREGGMKTVNSSQLTVYSKKKKTKRLLNIHNHSLPTSGIIFAFTP